jgi:hypothetical protein
METHTWFTTVELFYLVVVLMALIQLAGVLISRLRLSMLSAVKTDLQPPTSSPVVSIKRYPHRGIGKFIGLAR